MSVDQSGALAGRLAIDVLVHLTSVMRLWTCHSLFPYLSQKMATSVNYINIVKTAFKWRTNHWKFII